MTKALNYLILSGALTVFILWDLADYFKGGSGFARGDWETSKWGYPFCSYVLIILLQREKDSEKPVDQ